MKVLRLCWLGIPAQEYDSMVRFLRDVIGLRVEFEESVLRLFLEHASGPVALF